MDLVSVDIRGARSQQRTLSRVKSLIEQWQLHEEKVAAIADNDHSRLEKPKGLTLEERKRLGSRVEKILLGEKEAARAPSD